MKRINKTSHVPIRSYSVKYYSLTFLLLRSKSKSFLSPAFSVRRTEGGCYGLYPQDLGFLLRLHRKERGWPMPAEPDTISLL